MTAPLSKRVRFEVFKRDRFTCLYCGQRPPDVILEADHVTPRCEGGTDDMANLVTACFACNRGKAGVALENLAPALDEMTVMEGIQEMLERQLLLKRSLAATEATRKAGDEAVDAIVAWYEQALGSADCVDRRSIKRFLQQLDLDTMSQIIDSVAAKWASNYLKSSYGAWKYFCGACWCKIREQGDAG